MEEKELRTALTHWLIGSKDFEVFKKGDSRLKELHELNELNIRNYERNRTY